MRKPETSSATPPEACVARSGRWLGTRTSSSVPARARTATTATEYGTPTRSSNAPAAIGPSRRARFCATETERTAGGIPSGLTIVGIRAWTAGDPSAMHRPRQADRAAPRPKFRSPSPPSTRPQDAAAPMNIPVPSRTGCPPTRSSSGPRNGVRKSTGASWMKYSRPTCAGPDPGNEATCHWRVVMPIQ